MSDGNPPSSYYDPPEPEYAFELNAEKPADANEVCDRYACKEVAYMNVQVRDERVRYSSGWWVTVCKNHYESVIDDEIEAAEDYTPDPDED